MMVMVAAGRGADTGRNTFGVGVGMRVEIGLLDLSAGARSSKLFVNDLN